MRAMKGRVPGRQTCVSTRRYDFVPPKRVSAVAQAGRNALENAQAVVVDGEAWDSLRLRTTCAVRLLRDSVVCSGACEAGQSFVSRCGGNIDCGFLAVPEGLHRLAWGIAVGTLRAIIRDVRTARFEPSQLKQILSPYCFFKNRALCIELRLEGLTLKKPAGKW